jgi:DNA processing protein
MAVEHGRPVVLTDMVVEANAWARALVGRPGVHTAGSLDAVLTIIDEIVNGESELDADLRHLVST